MDTQEILIKIRKIVRSIDIESKKIQKEYGVSIPQVLCLSYLRESPNYQATQGEIRKYVNLNSSTVSGIINRLEKKGYLARLPKAGDKRVANIVLTSAGDELLKITPPLLHEQLSERLNKLDSAELTKLENGLESLVTLLDIDQVDASPIIMLKIDNEQSEDLDSEED